MTSPLWNPPRIDSLCERYGSGESLDSIARDWNVSRGTVIGKWSRLVRETAGWSPAYVEAMAEMFSVDLGLKVIATALSVSEEGVQAAFAVLRRSMGRQAR